MRIESTEEYQVVIARLEHLVKAGPERDSEQGIELRQLAETIEAYEKERWPI
jgi:antitoxin component HigA of HigAB toxin-antitoxin module